MRFFLIVLLVLCAGLGALFALSAMSDLRSAVQEIEMEIGVLIFAVAIGALYIAGTSKR